MNSTDRFVRVITQAYTQLEVSSARFDDKGQNNDVLIVNESLVFRFPIQRLLYPHMRAAARREVEAHVVRLINAVSEASFAPVLKHGDFGTSNLLFDSMTQQMRGVIDFGGACIGDPAYDIAGLLSGYGEAFVVRLAPSYPQLPQLMDRVRLYQGTFALMEALFGIENGDDEAFESGIAEYC